MKTKNLIFSLLFLILGTTVVWADKYYQPGSYHGDHNPRLTLDALANGRYFFIYNTAIDGAGKDYTGFLRNAGTSVVLDKSKERDRFVYNESFVYTMERHTGEDGTVWYAIKSVASGTYVNHEGQFVSQNAEDAKLSITDWDNATNKAGVNMESWKYAVVSGSNIKDSGHGSTVFAVKGLADNANSWHAHETAFTSWETAHPYAFYEANEVTSGAYLEDLHIYSRCDIHSAQVIYGCAPDYHEITTNDGTYCEPLIDGEAATECEIAAGDGYTFTLGGAESIYIYLRRNATHTHVPETIKIEVSADKNTWVNPQGSETAVTIATGLGSNISYTTAADSPIALGKGYKYVRISNATADAATSLSEAYVLPATDEVKEALAYINTAENTEESPVYTKEIVSGYTKTMEEYNETFPDAKLLSGVPLPGNKYRIYADAYDINAQIYRNQEICVNENGELGIKEEGSYHQAKFHKSDDDDKRYERYEWYCEQTVDGKLAFKNVATGKYLGYGAMSDSRYKWTMSTVNTQHFGVPLLNESMQYLAIENPNNNVINNFVNNVKRVHNATIAGAEVDDDNNAETEAQIYANGLCTDFVFIPVTTTEKEKKITFTASELVQRNTQLLFDADGNGTPERYSMPFAHMFTSQNLPTLKLLCSTTHSYAGINGEEESGKATINGSGNELTFNFNEIENGDILDINLEIVSPFEFFEFATNNTKAEPYLYLIRNARGQSVVQHARPQRANIEIGGEEAGPISPMSGNMYYANFVTRDKMELIEGGKVPNLGEGTKFSATSLFYFTKTEKEGNGEDYYSVQIHNATTAMKCTKDLTWNTQGASWFVQPQSASSFAGYNIGNTRLDATNNPNDAWCSNHDNGNNTILKHYANDPGSTWTFEKVEPENARKLLYDFIVKVYNELKKSLEEKAKDEVYDAERVGYYKYIVEELYNRASNYAIDNYTDNEGNNNTAKLLQYAQNIHMIEHEIEYALYKLPELSDETKMDAAAEYENPHWYYIKNVMSEDHYAAYTTDRDPMSLAQCPDGKQLNNMFYFAGEKNSYESVAKQAETITYRNLEGNNLIIDEYLKVHIHNFSANNNTVVSKNKVIFESHDNIEPGNGNGKDLGDVTLTKQMSWSIELEYTFDGKTQTNAWGSSLLSTYRDPNADTYAQTFQIFLKDDRSIVVKINDMNDSFRAYHTCDKFSKIKVVITHTQQALTFDIYNSDGEKETYIPAGDKAILNDIEALYANYNANGVQLKNLTIREIEEMNWKEHTTDKDLWYILPSSNLDYKGFAIVMDDAFDTNMGWANGEKKNSYINTDNGTADQSTWQFERITDFKLHMQQLLALWNLDECTVYHAPLVKIYKKLLELYASGKYDEPTFNEMVALIRSYNSMPKEEFYAPKADKLYTIRPANEETDYNHAAAADSDNQLVNSEGVFNYGPGKKTNVPVPGKTYYMYANATSKGKTWYLYNNNDVLDISDSKPELRDAAYCWKCIKAGENGQFYMQNGNGNYLANDGRHCLSLGETAAIYSMYNNSSTYHLKNESNPNNDHGKYMVTKADGGLNSHNSHWDREVAPKNDNNWCSNYIFEEAIPEYDSKAVWEFRSITRNETNEIDNVTCAAHNIHTLSYINSLNGSDSKSKLNGEAQITVKPIGSSVVSIQVGDKFLTRNTNGNYIYGGDEAVPGEINGVKDVNSPVTSWIIEEVADKEMVCYKRTVSKVGHSTLMLGFDAKIPEGIEAFYARKCVDIDNNFYVSMKSYDEGILPANAPVLLKKIGVSSIPGEYKDTEPADYKFYYSTTAATETEQDKRPILFGALYNTNVRCAYYRGNLLDGEDEWEYTHANNRIYMLQASSKEEYAPRLYQIWENRNESGNKVTTNDGNTNNNNGGYIRCSANMAYWVLPYDNTPNSTATSFALRYDAGSTTDIEIIEAEGSAAGLEMIETIHDLQGRKLNDITEPGIYIINGKKVIIK